MINENYWENRYNKDPKYRNQFPFSQVVSFLAKYKQNNHQTLLELGCGSGSNLLAGAEFGYDCYGIDISPTIVTYAKEFLSKHSIKANIHTASFTEVNFSNDFFDVIMDRSAICCANLSDMAKIIQKVHDMLKPNGIFYFNPAAEINSSKLIGSNFPIQIIANDNPYFGTSSCLSYYDEDSIRELLISFDIIEIKQNIIKIKDENDVSHKYSDYEVICKKQAQ